MSEDQLAVVGAMAPEVGHLPAESIREGKEHARRMFLTPRLLRDWLQLIDDVDG